MPKIEERIEVSFFSLSASKMPFEEIDLNYRFGVKTNTFATYENLFSST